MKKKGTAFIIPEPCNEEWNAMKPVSEGRFCSSCEKVVVDFSVMSDFQVLDFMKKSQESVCGRMSSAQINRTMFTPHTATISPGFSLRAVVLGTALTTFSALHVSGQENTGQVNVPPVQTEEPVIMKGEIAAIPEPASKLTGYIVTENSGDSLSNVTLTLFKADRTAVKSFITSEKGYFEIDLSASKASTDYIQISHSGFVSRSLSVADMRSGMTIQLIEKIDEPVIMGKMQLRPQK